MPEKVKETKIVQVVEPTQAIKTVDDFIFKAIEKGLTPEVMEQFMKMRREVMAEEAKHAFDEAMTQFQSQCPVITKNIQAKDEEKGTKLYKYASLDAIIDVASPILGRYGLSYSFKVETTPERVKVICIVKHVHGHTEESVMETNLATRTRIMSGPQQIAATVTFCKRYAFCNAFGIVTGGEDVEQDIPKEDTVIASNKQFAEIEALALRVPMTMKEVRERTKANYGLAYEKITPTIAEGIITVLKSKITV